MPRISDLIRVAAAIDLESEAYVALPSLSRSAFARVGFRSMYLVTDGDESDCVASSRKESTYLAKTT